MHSRKVGATNALEWGKTLVMESVPSSGGSSLGPESESALRAYERWVGVAWRVALVPRAVLFENFKKTRLEIAIFQGLFLQILRREYIS